MNRNKGILSVLGFFLIRLLTRQPRRLKSRIRDREAVISSRDLVRVLKKGEPQ